VRVCDGCYRKETKRRSTLSPEIQQKGVAEDPTAVKNMAEEDLLMLSTWSAETADQPTWFSNIFKAETEDAEEKEDPWVLISQCPLPYQQRRAAVLLLGRTLSGMQRSAYRKLSAFRAAKRAQRARHASIVALLERMRATGNMRYCFHQWMCAHERIRKAKLRRNAAVSMLVTTERGLQRFYFQKLLRHAKSHLKRARQRIAAAVLLVKTESGTRHSAYRKLSAFRAAKHTLRARHASTVALLERMTATGNMRYCFHQWLLITTERMLRDAC